MILVAPATGAAVPTNTDPGGGGGCSASTVTGSASDGSHGFTLTVASDSCEYPIRSWADCYYTGSRSNVVATALGPSVDQAGASSTANCDSWRVYGGYGWDEYSGGVWTRHTLGRA